MKYIRTKDGVVYKNALQMIDKNWQVKSKSGRYIKVSNNLIIDQADTIEELCDCYSYDIETTRDFAVARSWKLHNLEREIYGCIKTDKGLIYVAKMNDKGELELL